MQEQHAGFNFFEYNSINDLNDADKLLLEEAARTTADAYAPYSNFLVGAAAKLSNGEIVKGTNQENASYPAGICAERVLLSTAASVFPNTAVETMAISCKNQKGENNRPVAPCGICRQSLIEHESRFNNSIRLILGGIEGKVYIISSAKLLLPLSFTGDDLK